MAGKTLSIWSPTLGDVLLNAQLLNEILGSGEAGGVTDTAIVTAGAGTLTAAGLVGGQITRSGPTGAFNDTTDTAAHIQAALQGATFQAGQSFVVRIKNTTVWAQTLLAGTGVTLPLSIVIPALSVGLYIAVLGGTQAAPTITFVHTATVPLHQYQLLASTGIAVTGAGSITGAGVAGGLTTRTSQTAAATDTMDTGDNVIAAQPNLAQGQAFIWRYVNNGNFPITLAGASGTTLAAVVPAHSWAEFLVSYTAPSTIVFSMVQQGYFPKVGVTGVANGATPVTVADTRVTATSVVTLCINTVGGTAHGGFVTLLQAGVGFTFNSLAGDTSTYNYKIEG